MVVSGEAVEVVVVVEVEVVVFGEAVEVDVVVSVELVRLVASVLFGCSGPRF